MADIDTEQKGSDVWLNFPVAKEEHQEIKVAAARLGVTLREFFKIAAKEYIARQFPANGKE